MDKKIQYEIRSAIASDCAYLSALAVQSKAFWDYSDAFVQACKPVLTVTPAMIKKWRHGVAVFDEEIAGFYFLSIDGRQAELELLYITPHHMGNNAGKALFQAAEETARRMGCESLRIEADPNAVGFYRRMGARQTGWCRSEIEDARELPLMTKKLVSIPTR
ncbi:MAG: GNAT family N-acetyltransferase [Sneathiella sp.]|nr:MAG: GNAT family N-acetyltransferase [Sneathiella sp.]